MAPAVPDAGQRGPDPVEARAGQDAGEKEYQRAKEIVLRQLTHAARSRQQLFQKLAEKDVPEPTAVRVLDRFEELGLIDDLEYARMYVRSRSQSRALASSALRRELGQKGISAELAEEALGQLDQDEEKERARHLVEKKIRPERDLVDAAARDKALRRLAAMLARRGHGPGTAFEIARQALDARAAAEVTAEVTAESGD